MYADRPEPTPLAIEAQKRRAAEEREYRRRKLAREGGQGFFDGRYPTLTDREEDSCKLRCVLGWGERAALRPDGPDRAHMCSDQAEGETGEGDRPRPSAPHPRPNEGAERGEGRYSNASGAILSASTNRFVAAQ